MTQPTQGTEVEAALTNLLALRRAPVGLERIELVDSGRTWTRGDPLWPDTRAGVS